MRRRPLGDSGLDASVVGFGAWAIGGWMWGGSDKQEAIRAILAAIDSGIDLIDTAPVYGFGVSESIVGEAIRGRREAVILATKCGLVWDSEQGEFFFYSEDRAGTGRGGGHRVHKLLSPDSIRWELEQSLRRLGVDTIDLLQTHWQEGTTPIADTMAELMRLQEQGKIRAIGVSNATPAQMDAYRAVGAVACDQEAFSMLNQRQLEANLPYCREQGLAFLAYSPLAQGLLTGKIGADRVFREGDHRREKPLFSVENRRRVAALLDAMRPVAEGHGATLAQLAVAWTLRQPGCSHALVGSRTVAQARENAGAADLTLSEEELAVIDAAIAASGLGVPQQH